MDIDVGRKDGIGSSECAGTTDTSCNSYKLVVGKRCILMYIDSGIRREVEDAVVLSIQVSDDTTDSAGVFSGIFLVTVGNG